MGERSLPSEVSFLWEQMRRGEAFLLLGAGASRTSTNGKGTPIKDGMGLAEALAMRVGIAYHGERLAEVVQACVGRRLSETQWHDLLREEYLRCNPSKELKGLFGYSWARAYTLNVDDAVERIARLPSNQHLIPYNALNDRVASKDDKNPTDLHLVHLNGDANKPEHGLIFSREDYARTITERHPWYEELATDYHRFTAVIVGSRFDEPMLDVELERIKRRDGKSGAAFLIIPENLTEIQKEVFAARNIIHLPLTLNQFTDLARAELGETITVGALAASTNQELTTSVLASLKPEDIKAATAFFPVTIVGQQGALRQLQQNMGRKARDFLMGAPSDWPMALSEIPVELIEGKTLRPFIERAVADGKKLIVVTGAAGSGKSTLLRQTLLNMLKDDKGIVVYDLRGEAQTYNRVFSILRKLHPDRRVYLHLDNLFIYGDKLGADLEALRQNDIVVITSSRSGEWRERFQKYFGTMAAIFELKRFSEDDYGPLSDRLLRYVPSPTFSRATPNERLEKFRKSRRQLLIALREITESKRFDQVIEDEYSKLPDDATRFLFRVVGIATLARVGLEPAFASEIYRKRGFERSFDDALGALEGIVVRNSQNRLQVRHELYVEHIFRRKEPLANYLTGVEAILAALARFEVPLITSLSRLDAQLFKYLLNHRSLIRRCRAGADLRSGLKIYEKFEKEFEQDGHFWLQYALYTRSLGKLDVALELLDKSIQAYPENSLAIHARADLKLRIASDPTISHEQANAYIDEAVSDLLRLDARHSSRTDLYPIITLADRHVGALVKRGRLAEAKQLARNYFTRVQEREKQFGGTILR